MVTVTVKGLGQEDMRAKVHMARGGQGQEALSLHRERPEGHRVRIRLNEHGV